MADSIRIDSGTLVQAGHNITLTGQVIGGPNPTTLADVIINGPMTATTGTILIQSAHQIQLGADLTVGTNLEFQKAVLMTGDSTLTSTGGGNITFDSTVSDDGSSLTPSNLTVNTAGTTTFTGAVGGGANGALSSVTTDAPGTTVLDANITTTGIQTYNDAVQLAGNVTVTSTGSGAAANITFGGTVNDDGNSATASNLVVDTAGTTRFGGTVGGAANGALSSLTTDAAGSTSINANITTSGTQTYNDSITLTNDVILSGTSLTFAQNIDSDSIPRALTVNSSGNGVTTFDGLIGSSQVLASLTTNADGTTDFNGGTSGGALNTVTTTGTQTYNDAVVLTADATLVSTASGNITFKGTVNDDGLAGTTSKLVVGTSGVVEFDNTVGGAANGALTSLTIQPGGSTHLNASITTVGSQTYENAVILVGNSALTLTGAGTITFDQTIDGTTNLGQNLTLNANNGNILVVGAIGSTTKLGNLQIASANNSTFDASIDANSFQQLQSTPTGITTLDGTVNTYGTITASSDGFQFRGHDLEFAAGVSINSNGHNITIATDVLNLPTSGVTANTVTITAFSATTSIGVNSPGQSLNITSAALSQIHAANVVIGSTDQAAGIKIGSATAANNVNFSFISGSNVEIDGAFAVQGTGALSIQAGNAITMVGGSSVTAASGQIALSATGNVTLAHVSSTNDTAAAIQITSTSGGIVDGDTSTTNITDASSGAVATLKAATGIGSGGQAITTNIAGLDAINSTSGDISINQVSPTGMAIQEINQLGSGNVIINAEGTISVAASVVGVHATTGNISLIANGAASDLQLNGQVQTTGGTITLLADHSVFVGSTSAIQSNNGNVVISADALHVGSGSSGELFMQNGSVINTGTGTISLYADSDVTIGQIVTTNNTSSAVSITSTSGGLVNGGNLAGANIVADSAGAITTINTKVGVGSGQAVETNISNLQLINGSASSPLSGPTTNVSIVDTSGLNIVQLEQLNGGSVHVVANGLLQVSSGPGVTSTSGDITLTALGSQGQLLMSTTGQISSSTGNIFLAADQNVTLSQVQASTSGTSLISITSNFGSVVNGGNSSTINATGSELVIRAAQGIGSGNSLQTNIQQLSALNSGSGNIQIANVSGQVLTIGAANGVNGITNVGPSQGDIFVSNNSTIVVSPFSSPTNAPIYNESGGSIYVATQGGAFNIIVNSPIAATGGNGSITLSAGANVIVDDTGQVYDVAVVGSGTVFLTAGGNVILGSQNPTTTPAATQHTVANNVEILSGTGSVTNVLPLVYDIQSPQMTAQGFVNLSFTVGRPGETNITVTVYWGDGTFTSQTFANPGTYTYTHQYHSNPNKDDAAAPILMNVQVAHDPHIVITAPNVNTPVQNVPDIAVDDPPPVPAQNINTDFASAIYNPLDPNYASLHAIPLNNKIVSQPGTQDDPGAVMFQDISIRAIVVPVPGAGIHVFPFDTTPPVMYLHLPERLSPTEHHEVNLMPLVLSDNNRFDIASSEDAVAAERVVFLEIFRADGRIERVRLNEDVLDDLTAVIKKLPDGRYRFQLQEPGESRQRLLLDVFEVRQGKVVDESDSGDRPPSSAKKVNAPMTDNSNDGAAPAENGPVEMDEPVRDGVSMINDFSKEVASSTAPSAVGISNEGRHEWASSFARRVWQRAEHAADISETADSDQLTRVTMSDGMTGLNRGARLLRKYSLRDH